MSVQLPGADNFRSLKGMLAGNGRRIAGHTLLRSDQLHMLDEQAWGILETLGVKTVCDLRGKGERLRSPNNLPPALQQLALEVTSDLRADRQISALLGADPSPRGAQAMMCEVYLCLPGMLARHMSTLFGLFESGGVPVLIHCAAGKDRTGFAVAAILHALGVEQELIIADYQLSARRLADASEARREMMSGVFRKLVGHSCSDETIDVVMDARPEYLRIAYASVNRQYGSMDAYLEATAGLNRAALRRLRNRWLVKE